MDGRSLRRVVGGTESSIRCAHTSSWPTLNCPSQESLCFCEKGRLCSSSSALSWAPMVPYVKYLLLSQPFPPFPCFWLEELPLTWLISIQSKNCFETHLIIHPVLFLPVSKTHGKGREDKFKTETSFPLWLLQCTSLKTCAHRGVKPFMSCDTSQVAPATESSPSEPGPGACTLGMAAALFAASEAHLLWQRLTCLQTQPCACTMELHVHHVFHVHHGTGNNYCRNATLVPVFICI